MKDKIEILTNDLMVFETTQTIYKDVLIKLEENVGHEIYYDPDGKYVKGIILKDADGYYVKWNIEDERRPEDITRIKKENQEIFDYCWM